MRSSRVGPKVLKNAHNMERPIITRNCCQGKKKFMGMSVKSDYYTVIEKPTMVPIMIPSKLLESTRIKAS